LGVHVGTWQVPWVEPGCFTHPPPQQSLLVVQVPPSATQAASHMALVHGFPQQSALLAHAVPTGIGFVQSPTKWTRQRGMPSESAAQQLAGVLLQF